MVYVPGTTLKDAWAGRDKDCKAQGIYRTVDGSPSRDPLLGGSTDVAPRDMDDKTLRERIYAQFVATNGLSYKDVDDLPESLPYSGTFDMHEPVDITRDEIRRGRQYVECLNGSSWSRKVDTQTNEPIGEWARIDPAATEPSSSAMSLCAVLEDQAPNEPRHWSLFCYRPSIVDGTGLGQVWQVTGDAEQMYYNHEPNTDKLSSESFAWYQVLNGDLSDGQLAKIEEIVTTEPPPQGLATAGKGRNREESRY
ncbi:hypothetical protein PWT90_03044 [Aphanocladium album]|nr:hypothetical protein PWT90_03044 [Aphanocladium album]